MPFVFTDDYKPGMTGRQTMTPDKTDPSSPAGVTRREVLSGAAAVAAVAVAGAMSRKTQGAEERNQKMAKISIESYEYSLPYIFASTSTAAFAL